MAVNNDTTRPAYDQPIVFGAVCKGKNRVALSNYSKSRKWPSFVACQHRVYSWINHKSAHPSQLKRDVNCVKTIGWSRWSRLWTKIVTNRLSWVIFYMYRTYTLQLYRIVSRVFWIFLPNVIKISSYTVSKLVRFWDIGPSVFIHIPYPSICSNVCCFCFSVFVFLMKLVLVFAFVTSIITPLLSYLFWVQPSMWSVLTTVCCATEPTIQRRRSVVKIWGGQTPLFDPSFLLRLPCPPLLLPSP